MTSKENQNMINLPLDQKTKTLLAALAVKGKKSPDDLAVEIIREAVSKNAAGNPEFEENGVTYERLTVDLPKKIVDFYRYRAHAQGKEDLVSDLIAFDVADELRCLVDGMEPAKFRELFNLDSALADMARREEQIS